MPFAITTVNTGVDPEGFSAMVPPMRRPRSSAAAVRVVTTATGTGSGSGTR